MVDLSELIADVVVPALNAQTLATVRQASEAELYEFADEAAQRLARRAALFVERDAALALTAGVPTAATPARHLSTIHASLEYEDPGDFRPLRPASVAELEAKDSLWKTRRGNVTHWTQDLQGTETLRFYRIPAGNKTIALVYHEHPATLSSAAPTLTAPSVVGDYFSYAMLAAARAKESDEAMPEVAQYAAERVELFEQVFLSYWGSAQ